LLYLDRPHKEESGDWALHTRGTPDKLGYSLSYVPIKDADTIVLESFLDSAPEYLSGARLGEQLGVSRVAVHARLENLRDLGFTIDAVKHKGYRMAGEPPEMHAPLIRAYLRRRQSDAKFILFPEIDSTNSEAERQLAAGRQTPFAVIASRQTHGRGRLGRTWHSPEEGNCYISFAFRPRLPPAKMQVFTLWMGLHICNRVNASYNLPFMIKWPNDLVLDRRKAGGMLTEARIDADFTRDLIFGLGLNVNSACRNWQTDLAETAISLAEGARNPIPVNPLAADLLAWGCEGYAEFCEDFSESRFLNLWAQFDAIRGMPVTVRRDQHLTSGVAEGIEPDGSLRLREANGNTALFRSGEVSLGGIEMLREPGEVAHSGS
jgi:BirA family biotin operon repressor/biotin-[acetyl-CoA-carboxylase] ligase